MSRRVLARLRALFIRNRLERELDAEVRFHLEMMAEENQQKGMDPAEARYAAMRSFGGVETMKETHRETRALTLLETAARDLRHAVRMLRRSPAFTIAAVLSLALGIGANTAIFTLIDATMLRSLPVHAPAELCSVGDASRPTALWFGWPPLLNVFSYPLYQRLRDQNHVFSGLLASGAAGRLELDAGSGAREEVRGRLVSDNYFAVLGISPVLGRTFSPDEEGRPGASPALVISYDYWVNRFARDPNVLGRTLKLNGYAFAVIGVGPRHFTGEVVGSPADLWIPLSMQAQLAPGDRRLDKRDVHWLLCMGRLLPGVSIGQAHAEMTALGQQTLIDYEGPALPPDKLQEIRNQTVQVEPGGKGFSWIRKHESPLLFNLMGAVALVLLIACANVGNLLLARATNRQKEIAVRLAMGASRTRLLRQLLTESALLAAMGGSLGLLLAKWGSLLVSQLAAGGHSPVPFEVDVQPNASVLIFTAALSFLTAFLFGLVPALGSTRVDLAPTLKENAGSRIGGPLRFGQILVIAQLALSLVLLILAGLFVRSVANLKTLDVGYSRTNLVLAPVDLAGSGYAPARQLPVIRTLLVRLNSIPGVLGATVSANGIFSGIDSTTGSLGVEGFTPLQKSDTLCNLDEVGPRYFQILGVPLLAGREFDLHDAFGSPPVAIVNETMARYYFGQQDPIGRRILNGGDRYTIIGVARDMKERDLKGKTERRFFVPLFQDSDAIAGVHFEVRTRDDPARIIPSVRRELRLFDPNLKASSIKPVRSLMDESISEDRLAAQLFGFFGLLALILAVCGLYGVISYATSRRFNEIGLRLALGAGRTDVMRMILADTLELVLVGFAIGIPAALIATHLVAATLVDLGPGDPATFALAICTMLAAAVLAGLVPARRASRIDPALTLRQE